MDKPLTPKDLRHELPSEPRPRILRARLCRRAGSLLCYRPCVLRRLPHCEMGHGSLQTNEVWEPAASPLKPPPLTLCDCLQWGDCGNLARRSRGPHHLTLRKLPSIRKIVCAFRLEPGTQSSLVIRTDLALPWFRCRNREFRTARNRLENESF
jgi:hypothetical protein